MSEYQITMPKNVAYIIDTLEENGYEAFAVGGCVRDALMGREAHDWDITTSAKPLEVKALFRHTIDTGIKHGTVTVMLDHVGYEVTTYRIDGEYSDGRHPVEVEFTNNLVEDLKRRDFTINAMAYNYRAGIIDVFGGVSDINNGIIRCVRVATERFEEDALRILRALRFSAQLNFSISDDTCDAIKLLGANLTKISKERIQTEIGKLICSNHPDRITLVQLFGLGKYIFENANVLTMDNPTLYGNISKLLTALPNDYYLRFAALTHYEDNPSKVLKTLKMDNKTIDIASRLKKAYTAELPSDKHSLRKNIVSFGKDLYDSYYFPYLFAVESAGLYDKGLASDIRKVYDMYQEIISDGDCTSIKELKVNGNTLKEHGFPDGKQLGNILNHLLDVVLASPEKNNFDTLIAIAKDYCKQ